MGESMSNISDQSNPRERISQVNLVYAQHYQQVVESLYFEQGDGEIFIAKTEEGERMVTCVDISTLYRGKRGKAIVLIEQLTKFKHPCIVEILKWWMIQDKLIFIEMEMPKVVSQWKSYCKRKLSTQETIDSFHNLVQAVNFLHSQGFTHRDVHPSRVQQMQDRVKFNLVGFPYNFKKLLKREDFSGHINYSATELILEKADLSNKIDLWALGCTLFFMLHKKDSFDGRDPNEIKKNILNFNQ